VIYALVAGGGETLPLMIANLLHQRGHTVIVLDFHQLPSEPGVRAMLDPAIPLLRLTQPPLLHAILVDMGVDIVHSHHAWVDMTIAALLPRERRVKHVVTMHGMYELMTPELFASLQSNIESVDAFVYTAEKNLAPFAPELRARKDFVRINNAVIARPYGPISRVDLGLADHDFVLCMVARGIPEKGWQEAIQAVLLANQHSARSIHLLLIGDGAEPERLKPLYGHEARIHFLDFQANIRSFFACSDMGFIPSRFQGESFPLVLIDCLATGRPVLASAIGEISRMLATSKGTAGVLFPLDDWQVPIRPLAMQIAQLANDPVRYQELCSCVPEASSQFDPERMVMAYEDVYLSLCNSVKFPSPFREIYPDTVEVHQS
jgi:glycosyltransferase involved in cell wall biosynthesis